jgi:hypothetical protein
VANLTTQVHMSGSANHIETDLPYLQAITRAVYASNAIVFRDWIYAASSRRKQGVIDAEADWKDILDENIKAIKKSDLVVIETTRLRFSQGLQACIASQHKKPTLLVTRSQITDYSGLEATSKFITIKHYTTEQELSDLVSKFIKQNSIPEKDLRFNMILDRRIYKYLRDKSYETGKNKSEIVRGVIEREIEERNP